MRKRILFIIALVVFSGLPARAEILDFNLDFQVQPTTSGGIEIQRDLDLQRRQTTEIIRGNDLTGAVKELVRKTKELLRGLKARQTDQIRGAELTQITNQNTTDVIRRNKVMQQMQKQQQRDQMRAVKARNDALKERLRDLSRK